MSRAVIAQGEVRTVYGSGVATLTIEFAEPPAEAARADIQMAAVAAGDHAARFFEKCTASLKEIAA